MHDRVTDRMTNVVSIGALLGGLALLASLCSGCGHDALRMHAQAATVTAGTVAVAGATIDAARSAALDRVEAAHPQRGPERDAALEEEHRRWLPAGAALDATREGGIAWARSIELARVGGGGEDLVVAITPIAARALLLYDRAAQVATQLGTELPTLPSWIRSLVQMAGGGR